VSCGDPPWVGTTPVDMGRDDPVEMCCARPVAPHDGKDKAAAASGGCLSG
jgi:hypothetical protein